MAFDTSNPAALGFDPDALREKYRQERDKRLRTDGEAQFLEQDSDLAQFVSEEDPYADPGFTRAPMTDEIDVVVIGGGMAGLITATRMKAEGIEDVRIIEAAADFGGVWYWNRYPGAQCDIESHCYLPLLEETNYVPKEKYSYAPEIFEQMRRIGRTFDLYKGAIFRTSVAALDWDESLKRWIISTNRNDAIRARFVVLATGPANRARLPNIPGIKDFKGRMFHTSRWDFDYTGGDHSGNLHKLADKTVGVIGTGASGVQCIPYLGADAKQLYVFQRTPSSVDVRGNRPTDPEWAKTLQPGWVKQRRDNFHTIVTGQPFEDDLVNDAWTDIFRNVKSERAGRKLVNPDGLPPEEMARIAELSDFKKMNQLRARVDQYVKDPEVAEKLKPWYRHFCKRPTFNDEYLPTFNRPNVTLVDTSACKGVQRITEDGVVANDVEYKLDLLIFATGFEITSGYRRRIGFEIRGRGGQSIYDHWGRGMRTLHGHSSHGFPNWFYVGAGQNAGTINFSYWINGPAEHVAHIIKQVMDRNAETVEPTAEAEAEWVDTIHSLSSPNDAFLAACTPGYYNNEGGFKDSVNRVGGDLYAPGVTAFNALMQAWRDAGDLKGLKLT